MIDRRLIYVAGPYGASTSEEIERNVYRACALGRLVTATGCVPVVPHAAGFLGCHGDPHEQDGGQTREVALACGVALASVVGRQGGNLWVLLRDDKSMSEGTKSEADAFASTLGRGVVLRDTWAGWKLAFQQHGLLPLWESLL